jgi:hypothetical protein
MGLFTVGIKMVFQMFVVVLLSIIELKTYYKWLHLAPVAWTILINLVGKSCSTDMQLSV